MFLKEFGQTLEELRVVDVFGGVATSVTGTIDNP
jgi:hypothetical protein